MYPRSVVLNASVLLSVLIVVIIYSPGFDFQQTASTAKFNISLYALIPAKDDDPVANLTAGAIVLAVDAIRKRNVLPDFNVDWRADDQPCSARLMVKKFHTQWLKGMATMSHIVFSGYCEPVCRILVIISYVANTPFFAVSCRENEERKYVLYPSFLAFNYDRSTVMPGIIAMMKAYEWSTLAILTTADKTSYDLGLKAKIAIDALKNDTNNWNAIFKVSTMNLVPEGPTSPAADDELELILDDIKKQARIVFLAVDKAHCGHILVMAQRQGMYNGEYAFIGFDLTSADAKKVNATEEEWKTAKVGLISIRASNVYDSLEDNEFVSRINRLVYKDSPMNKLGWINQQTLRSSDIMHVRTAGSLYMSIRLYAFLVNHTLTTKGFTPTSDASFVESILRNGTLLMSDIGESSIEAAETITDVKGSLSTMHFDKNGVRIPTWIFQNTRESDEVKEICRYSFEDNKVVSETFHDPQMVWPGKSTQRPVNEPECGYEREKCMSTLELTLVCTGGVLLFLVFAGIISAIFVSRRMKAEAERKTLAEWQLKWSQVVVIGDNVIGRISAHDANRSKMSFETASHAETGDMRSVHKSLTNRLFTFTGTYKGKMVAIKKINRDSVSVLQHDIFNEIKQLLYISHENVNPFIGVCSEAPNVCVLMMYADRGSLQDVLAEAKYDINWEFRICLATDIAKGMDYLHESPIGPHGHLTSANCVVDRKWECQITDYGLKLFKRSKDQEISAFKWNSDLLWTAPEILKKPETDRDRMYGTKGGDVYSFGIIVSEIITKEMPYYAQLETISPEDVVLKLKRDPQYRPRLPTPEGPIGTGWNSLATICWHQKPEVRPNFVTIQGKLRSIHGGKMPNLMHRMQHMMEDALEHKAAEIEGEKKKTEKVVYNLLPQSIAAEITAGNEVRSQRSESVTLCFCETPDIFTSLKGMSPFQVTEIIKLLFRSYDDITKKFNVIEVSGRGSKDSMILASGLPEYTKKHAEDICEMSLDLISGALAFKTPLAPALSINIKISVHSGPLLTAVIWRILPRYSASGEAVDTLRVMQSASKAMRVRISDATYKHISRSGSYTVEQGGKVTVKNGKPIKTYWLTGKTGYRKALPDSIKRRSSSLKGQEMEGRKSK